MNKYISLAILFLLALSSCKQKAPSTEIQNAAESKEAKALLQGIWIDSDAESVAFRVKGDTIYYPDSTSLPAYFRIVNDTMIIGEGGAAYPVVKQTEHLFWFKNHNSDIVKLSKSDSAEDSLAFVRRKPEVLTVTKVLKRDTVVVYDNNRYHCYIAINPTKYKVRKPVYNEDGVEVENVYYDNIIHLSVFQGAQRIYSRDINKQLFAKDVPQQFLKQAILGNLEYDKTDASGFHFYATLCIPDEASCYLVETIISFNGQLSMELLQY